MGNRQRIIDESLRLMNEQGAQAIGTTQITEALSISPGNLYYHFKNKEEIVRTLFTALDSEIHGIFEPAANSPIQPAVLTSFFIGTFRVAWHYRFFFGGLLHLLRRDEVLAGEYQALQAWTLDRVESVCRQLSKEGVLTKPKGRNGFKILALNLWILWSNWIRYSQISAVGHKMSQLDIITGVKQLFELMSPHLTDDYDRAVRRVMSRELANARTLILK